MQYPKVGPGVWTNIALKYYFLKHLIFYFSLVKIFSSFFFPFIWTFEGFEGFSVHLLEQCLTVTILSFIQTMVSTAVIDHLDFLQADRHIR